MNTWVGKTTYIRIKKTVECPHQLFAANESLKFHKIHQYFRTILGKILQKNQLGGDLSEAKT